MKYVIKYIFLFSFVFFSFYYADKVAKVMIDKSELMKIIKKEAINYNKISNDAIIIDNSIIPGKNGVLVDELESYYQMKSNNIFDASKLVFKQIKPNISIDNYKELVINKVSTKKGIALVFKDNKYIVGYLKDNELAITRLVNSDSFNKKSKYEQIGLDTQTDRLLKKYKLDKHICFNNYLSKEFCIKNNKYLVESTYTINSTRRLDNKLISGNILFLDDNLSLSDFKYLLYKIKFHDLPLYYLSSFISEEV